MASATWTQPSLYYSPALPLKRAPTDDDELPSSPSSVIAGRPSLLRRFAWRHAVLLHEVQSIVLLLLLGVSANVLALLIDHAIETLVAWRARSAQEAGSFLPSYFIWVGSSLVLCSLSAATVHFIGPSSAGSGIPQMKCTLAGMAGANDYLSLRTLIAKCISLVLALGGGLSIGKEGPYVHISSCLAYLLCQLHGFRRLGHDEELRRQVLAAGCAAGVSATFGAPVGGVLFSIEVTSTYYSISHLWKAMFTSVCGALVFRISRDTGSLALFNLTDFPPMGDLLYNGEIYAFALLGCILGLLGSAFIHATASLVQARCTPPPPPPHPTRRDASPLTVPTVSVRSSCASSASRSPPTGRTRRRVPRV